jgi:cytoskeletal protein CcmA (bactofilin family)
MFGKSKQKFRAPRISTVIGSGTEVQGDIHFVDGLHVDGVIKGDVISDPQDPGATLTLSELGTIEGNVRVGNVMLNGTVVGDVIAANRVELAPKARITGTLTYVLLEMSMGAEINGKLIHAEQEPKKLEFDGNKKASVKQGAAEKQQANKQPAAKPAVGANKPSPVNGGLSENQPPKPPQANGERDSRNS